MKVTKSLVIAALVAGNLLVSDLALQAQGATNAPPPGGSPGGPGMRGRPDFDMIARQLNLTDDQTPKFKSIMESRMQKIRDLRQDPDFASMSPDERRAKVKAIQDETTAQLKALLTPEQFDKWQKISRMGMRERRMGPPPGGPDSGSTNAPAPPPANSPQQ